MISYIIIGILVVLLGVLGYTTLNLLRKNETAEDLILGYLERLSQVIDLTDEKLKKLDSKGSFKSDDEIGFFFNQVMELQKILNEFNIKTIDKDGSNNSQT